MEVDTATNRAQLSGLKALTSGLQACYCLAECVRSTLGPYGMNKMLIREEDARQLVTNDGATILSALNIQHPVASILVELAKSQDESAGDGTTSTVLLCAEILREAEAAMHSKFTRASIIRGFQTALQLCLRIIDMTATSSSVSPSSSSIHTATLSDVEIKLLTDIASTSASSKVLNQHLSFFAHLSVQCMAKSKSISRVHVESFPGGSMTDSKMFEGLIVPDKKVTGNTKHVRESDDSTVPTASRTYSVAVTRFDLDRWSPWNNSKLVVDSDEVELSNMVQMEREQLRLRCTKLIALGVNIVIHHGIVSSTALDVFTENNVTVIQNAGFDICSRSCQAASATEITDVDTMSEKMLGSFSAVEWIHVGTERFLRCLPAGQLPSTEPTVTTVILRAPTLTLLDECVRAFHDVLCVLHSYLNSRSYVGGAGAIELLLSTCLSQYATTCSTVDRFMIGAFARALLVIPRTLIANAGHEVVHLLSEALLSYAQQQSTVVRSIVARLQEEATGSIDAAVRVDWMGVELHSGSVTRVADTTTASQPVLEVAAVVQSMIRSAVEAAETVLRIDNILVYEPHLTPQELGISR